jgi:hypothetical protein
MTNSNEPSDKEDIIIRLLALLLVKGEESQKDKITLLNRAGLDSRSISEILDTTRNTVSVAISTSKKQK